MKEKNTKRPDSNRPVEEALQLLKTSQLPEELRRMHAETHCPLPEVLERFRRGELAGEEVQHAVNPEGRGPIRRIGWRDEGLGGNGDWS